MVFKLLVFTVAFINESHLNKINNDNNKCCGFVALRCVYCWINDMVSLQSTLKLN